MEKEIRSYGEQCEIESRDEIKRLVGYAARFDKLSEDLGGFREKILPGAFADVLADDVRLLVNHEGLPLARTASGTLQLTQDDKGLRVEVNSIDASDPDWQAVLPKLAKRDLSQMSFAFLVEAQNWIDEGKKLTREIVKVKRLYDVSLVTYPAYPQTAVALRSLEQWREAHGCEDRWALNKMRLALAERNL